MKVFQFISLAVLLAVCSASDSSDEYTEFVYQVARDPKMQAEFSESVRKLVAKEPHYFDYTPFRNQNYPRWSCAPMAPSNPAPTSVHKLRPSDIKAVAALGDSLTAAAGSNANTIIGMVLESRGQSFPIGADQTLEERVALGNILRKYNPDVRGVSIGANPVYMQDYFQNSGLNVAVSGAKARHMLQQAKHLVASFKNMTDFDYMNEWKLVTLFIGGNDICGWCKNKPDHHPDLFVSRIKEALDYLKAELPKTFVNLVTVLDASLVKHMPIGPLCAYFHERFCRCGAFPANQQEELDLALTIKKYQEGTNALVNSGVYDERDDFTVVVQPFLEDMELPLDAEGEADMTYFAPDCFHFGQKAHAESAVALWNNMLEPVGQKQTTWTLGGGLRCPDNAVPYLRTAKN